jgi:membrane protein DedA with SNARE-associated domain
MITFFGGLIIISTQFVKQHVILDMIFAIILGEVIFYFVYKLNIEKAFYDIKSFANSIFQNENAENYKLK